MKKLASNNRELKTTLPIILFFISLITSIVFLKNYGFHLLITIIASVFIFFIIISRIYNKAENIFYDTDYLYLVSNNGKKSIKLAKIKQLKLTLSKYTILGMQYYLYKIDYEVSDYERDSITFWISSLSDDLKEFEKMVEITTQKLKLSITPTLLIINKYL